MPKSAGEGKDWVQEMTMHPPKKDEVNIALSKMTRQPTKHLLKKDVGVPSKKQGNWILWFLKPQGQVRGSWWKQGVRARRWWTGSVATQGKVGVGIGWECPKAIAGDDGARPSSREGGDSHLQ